jgi:hypothetical protein
MSDRHRERRATKATLHRERKGLRCSFPLSSPREESHQGSSSSGEEDTQPPNLLSSPREESHQGDSSSGEEIYSTTQPALITEREEPPRQLFIGRGEDFGDWRRH